MWVNRSPIVIRAVQWCSYTGGSPCSPRLMVILVELYEHRTRSWTILLLMHYKRQYVIHRWLTVFSLWKEMNSDMRVFVKGGQWTISAAQWTPILPRLSDCGKQKKKQKNSVSTWKTTFKIAFVINASLIACSNITQCRGVSEMYDTLRSVHTPAVCCAVKQHEGESVQFSYFSTECFVDLQDNFFPRSEAAFAKTELKRTDAERRTLSSSCIWSRVGICDYLKCRDLCDSLYLIDRIWVLNSGW